ncbi:STAS domain-containing protein [Lignipirellula cremea]|uniref:Anti-sigma factor antagonist BtrV n=1 Tax=Lignipirellula cremea TaxID=2528010 RepID=A0A518DYG3_9BACT|nr:STAS domain-containing protein [Lignipirellula cremea]QDU96835.1 Putative anti-sigma factor antagonist BtrV [Lignipirellula cremea]
MPQDYRLLTIESRQDDEILVVCLRGIDLIDRIYAQDFQRELSLLIQERQPGKLVVSFRNLGLCSTEVVNGMLQVRQQMLAVQGRLALCEMSPQIRQVFRVLNLEQTVFEIYDALEDATLALAS